MLWWCFQVSIFGHLGFFSRISFSSIFVFIGPCSSPLVQKLILLKNPLATFWRSAEVGARLIA
jgi:hypothetical protein